MIKKLFERPRFVQFFSWLVARYLKRVARKSHLALHAPKTFWQAQKEGQKPMILVFWHNQMALAPFAWSLGKPFYMLISDHRDGRFISKIIQHFGLNTFQGSSSRGKGAMSLRGLLNLLKQGHSIGMTPDGPRGPMHTIKPGVFFAALSSQCPVYTLSWCAPKVSVLNTWDGFIWPWPVRGRRDKKGGPRPRACLVVSEPIAPPEHRDQQEDFLKQVFQSLQKTAEEAHQRCWHLS